MKLLIVIALISISNCVKENNQQPEIIYEKEPIRNEISEIQYLRNQPNAYKIDTVKDLLRKL